MKRIFFLVIFLVGFIQLTVAQYCPQCNGEVVNHSYYTLSYNEEHEQANWVYYIVQKGTSERTDDFRPDPKVATGSASLSDYKGSGYDRGHICPAAAMKINKNAMSETFYMSNMSPQIPGFNRGIWKKLEALVRGWGYYRETHVVSGPVFKDNKGSIGVNKVTIPGYYYKVVYQPSTDNMIAFLLPHESSNAQFSSFVVSVDSVEEVVGVDFFSQLDDVLEDRLEARVGDVNDWQGQGVVSLQKNILREDNIGIANQCRGVAKSTGSRCKNKTNNTNGYCSVHKDQAPDYQASPKSNYIGRCCATTQKGTRCKRNASSGSKYCWQHK